MLWLMSKKISIGLDAICHLLEQVDVATMDLPLGEEPAKRHKAVLKQAATAVHEDVMAALLDKEPWP